MMHFNKKLDVHNALLRISDSLAFGAAARHVYAVVDDADNKRKLFVKGKNNLAAYDQANKTLAFHFDSRIVGTDDAGKKIEAPIVWGLKHVDITAAAAMSAGKSSSARDDAKEFLAGLLAAGPILKSDIEDAAGGNGVAERTLFRAKAELGVIARKDGDGGAWRWHLPNKKPRMPR
jgi:hypothetical protein